MLFGVKTGLIASLSGHTSSVRTVSVLPDGKLVSGSRDRSVRVWQLPPLNAKRRSSKSSSHHDLHSHKDDHNELSNGGRCLGVIESHENNGVYSVCCLANGNVAVSSEDHCMQLWSLTWIDTSSSGSSSYSDPPDWKTDPFKSAISVCFDFSARVQFGFSLTTCVPKSWPSDQQIACSRGRIVESCSVSVRRRR
jgi:hypothetical protein